MTYATPRKSIAMTSPHQYFASSRALHARQSSAITSAASLRHVRPMLALETMDRAVLSAYWPMTGSSAEFSTATPAETTAREYWKAVRR